MTETKTSQPVKLSVLAMTSMVVGSMVGAGVFSLSGRFARETGVAGALIAWIIAGAGMLMLAFVFQMLAVRKPKLDAGVYAYAKEGFGEYFGFFPDLATGPAPVRATPFTGCSSCPLLPDWAWADWVPETRF